jgi:Tfp pilus assembly protein PilV
MMPVLKDTRGLSLVEVMIAMVVLLFVSLALMQTALVSIESNMKNVLRDEAVAIAEERINQARALPFASLTAPGDTTALPILPANPGCPTDFIAGPPAHANGIVYVVNPPTAFVPTATVRGRSGLKNVTSFVYCTNSMVTNMGVDNKTVEITVGWSWKGTTYTHASTAVIRNEL